MAFFVQIDIHLRHGGFSKVESSVILVSPLVRASNVRGFFGIMI